MHMAARESGDAHGCKREWRCTWLQERVEMHMAARESGDARGCKKEWRCTWLQESGDAHGCKSVEMHMAASESGVQGRLAFRPGCLV